DLRAGVGREADQQVRSDQLAHFGDRHVPLPPVYPLGTPLPAGGPPVVYDQQRAQALAQRVPGIGAGHQLLVGELLVAQLHDLHAAGDRGAQHVGQRPPAGSGVAHQVQPRGREPRAPVGAKVHSGHRFAVSQERPWPATVASINRMSSNGSSASSPDVIASPDVIVVGAGMVGLAVAWRARERGMSVTVLERDAAGRGTSYVAAGMLGPVAEGEFGETGRRVLELGMRSAEMWPAFAERLQAAADIQVGLSRTGTLLVARDEDEARDLSGQFAFRDSLGLRTTRLRPSDAREREPALAPTVRLALEAPDDHSVDPRLVLVALRTACASAGVQLRERANVARIESDGAGGRVAGGTLASDCDGGGFLPAGQVVIAAGAWTGQIAGISDRERVPVRPVRGQLLRLRDPAGAGLLRRIVRFQGGYLVPRADGRYVLGATVEERGFDLQPAVGGVYELLRDAHELVPGVSELQIEELCVGLRPGTPDNAPAIGAGALDGLTWATGHYRNGILLAPLTAELVAGLLADAGGAGRAGAGDERPAEELLAACAPLRFATAASAMTTAARRPHASHHAGPSRSTAGST